MSEWGVVSIIVFCLFVSFCVQILLCYAIFSVGNRSIADDAEMDNRQLSDIHKTNEGSPCESPSLSNELSNKQ